MGASSKSLERLMSLTKSGALPIEAAICDIGATQLFGYGVAETAREFLAFYSACTAKATPPDDVPPAKLAVIADGGFLGDLLVLAGFRYTALDIFRGPNTILFDLNIHAPGPKLSGQFDLVLNFGTTEHVFNQLRAFQTIHELTKVGSVIYHDLPMAGYLNHAFFRYDPLFFTTLQQANGYELVSVLVTTGGVVCEVPNELREAGYTEDYRDVGIEVMLRRINADRFRIPMEATTALSIDPEFARIVGDDFVVMPVGTSVNYGAGMDSKGEIAKSLPSIEETPSRELLGLLIARLRNRVIRDLG